MADQAVQDDIFGNERKPNGDKLAQIFIGDTYIGDQTLEAHFASVQQLLERARKSGVEFSIDSPKANLPLTMSYF